MNKLSEKVNKSLSIPVIKKISKMVSRGDIKDIFQLFLTAKTNSFYRAADTILPWAEQKAADSVIEIIVYNLFQKEDINFKFQKKIGPYRVDFLINKLIIEIDGPRHWKNQKQIKHDKARDNFLFSKGYQVLRIRTKSLIANPKKFIKIIKNLSERYK